MSRNWLANVRVPAQTMRDLSDVEWLKSLRECYGDKRVHLGDPQDAVGRPASYWQERGMDGLYVNDDPNDPAPRPLRAVDIPKPI